MSYIGNTPGVSSQRVVLEEVVTGSPKSAFVPQSGYIIGYVDVLVNGVEIDSTDFSAPDGVTVTLATAAAVGDTVKVKTWLPRGLSDGYLKSEADARFLKLDGTNAVLGGGSFSGWGATHKALQFGALGAVSSDPGWTRIWQNVYSDGTNYRYTANGGAGLLLMGYQGMYAYTAPSGTAGNVATMTNILGLDLSGNLSLAGGLTLAAGKTFSDGYGSLERNFVWTHGNGGYTAIGNGILVRQRLLSPVSNCSEFTFAIDIGTDGYSTSTQYFYFQLPTGTTTYMTGMSVEAFSGGWNWSQVAGYRRWSITSVANSWVTTLREDNAVSGMTNFSCSATAVGSSYVKIGFTNTGGRGTFTIKITCSGDNLSSATNSYQTNTNPF